MLVNSISEAATRRYHTMRPVNILFNPAGDFVEFRVQPSDLGRQLDSSLAARLRRAVSPFPSRQTRRSRS
jgi:hypothetical protein